MQAEQPESKSSGEAPPPRPSSACGRLGGFQGGHCQAPLCPHASHPGREAQTAGLGGELWAARSLKPRCLPPGTQPGQSSLPTLLLVQNRHFHPLPCCSRGQQSKTNMQTRQTYFFDSLNTKKKKKKKKLKSQQMLHQSRALLPQCSVWGLLRSLVGTVGAFVLGNPIPGSHPPQVDLGLWS